MKLATHRSPQLVLTDHEFQVPLDHGKPSGPRMTIFAREVNAAGRENANLPWLLFLQGGPRSGPSAATGCWAACIATALSS